MSPYPAVNRLNWFFVFAFLPEISDLLRPKYPQKNKTKISGDKKTRSFVNDGRAGAHRTRRLCAKFPGQSLGTILDVRKFPAGISNHGNLRDYLNGIRPSREPFPRELATTGMHGIVCTGTDHHGKAYCGNRPPREIFPRERVTTGISRDFLPRKRPPWYFTGRG